MIVIVGMGIGSLEEKGEGLLGWRWGEWILWLLMMMGVLEGCRAMIRALGMFIGCELGEEGER